MKKGLVIFLKIGKGAAVIAGILFLVFSPFFLIIKKEKMVRELSQKREKLNGEILRMKSETASLELKIGQLSSAERLETYAREQLALAPADPQRVIVVQRSKDGAIIVEKNPEENFLYKLMGKQ